MRPAALGLRGRGSTKPFAVLPDRLKTSLKQVSGPAVATVEGLRGASIQFTHPFGQIAIRGLDQQVVVIADQAVSMAEPTNS